MGTSPLILNLCIFSSSSFGSSPQHPPGTTTRIFVYAERNKVGVHDGRICILREVCVNLQRMPQRPCAMFAFLLVGTVFVVFPASAGAQAQPSTQSLDGLWLTDGYGELIEFQGEELRSFEITKRTTISGE